jgi:hypothetical protein
MRAKVLFIRYVASQCVCLEMRMGQHDAHGKLTAELFVVKGKYESFFLLRQVGSENHVTKVSPQAR